jgi:hypothetical protein
MLRKASTESTAKFAVTRLIKRHDAGEGDYFAASIELRAKSLILLTLNESELYLTAHQCAELVDKLAELMSTCLKLGALSGKLRTQINPDTYRTLSIVLGGRTMAHKHDHLRSRCSDVPGYEYGASGSFQSHDPEIGEAGFYKVAMGWEGALGLPFFRIEDRVFHLDFGEMMWLVEQLWIGGFLLAHFEKPAPRRKRNSDG